MAQFVHDYAEPKLHYVDNDMDRCPEMPSVNVLASLVYYGLYSFIIEHENDFDVYYWTPEHWVDAAAALINIWVKLDDRLREAIAKLDASTYAQVLLIAVANRREDFSCQDRPNGL